MIRFRRLGITALLAITLGTGNAHAQSTPLTLDRAIAEALVASPALRAPDDDRSLASIRERQAAARLGTKVTPTVQWGTDPAGFDTRSIGFGLTRRLPTGTTVQVNGSSTQFGSGAGLFRDNGYSFGFSQPLLRGWTKVASADLDQARRGSRSASRNYADARQRLVVSVVEDYASLIRLRRLVDAAERTLERAQQLKTQSDARSKVGLATELDVLRADLLIAQSEAALVTEREARDSAIDALKALVAWPSDRPLEIADLVLNGLVDPSNQPVEQLVHTALANRLDAQEAQDRVEDARLTETVARWNLLPPITVDATYAKHGLGSGMSYPFGQYINGWRLGLSTSYSLDRSDENAAAATAAVSVAAARHEAEDVERRIGDEVRRAYRSWTSTKSTLEIQLKAVTIAERQLRLAQLRYDRGVAGNFDVIDAENGLLQARSALIGAEVDRAVAGLMLSRVTGSLDPARFHP